MSKQQRKYFGTDGVRGQANSDPMTPEMAMKIAFAAGRYFQKGTHRHHVVIGKDTRLSGYMIEAAMTAGFISAGMDVVLLGPMPTPAVAMLTPSLRADLGVMISASHNPFQDNGIKFFDDQGHKLPDEVELAIEALIEDNQEKAFRAPPEKLGRARKLDDEEGRYIEFLKASLPRGLRLDGLKIALDCAHGAAYKVAPMILWELGAEIFPMGVNPNGTNINDQCGATHIEALQAHVVKQGADIGIALDGDADRLILVDEKGQKIDGDQLLAMMATSWAARGSLKGDGIAATILSNLGLEEFLASQNLKLYRSAVGDRYVLEMMKEKGLNLGGEQSGHIIMADHLSTGDGLMAALQVLALMVEAQKPISESAHLFTPFPQMTQNIRFAGVNPLAAPSLQKSLAAIEQDLALNHARMVVRKSGTEPLIRLMVEGRDEKLIANALDEAAGLVSQEITKDVEAA